MTNFLSALILTMIAGLATGIGGLFVLAKKEINSKVLSIALGFSGGVMLYISFMEIIRESEGYFLETQTERNALIFAALSFFGGIAIMWLIDRLVPDGTNPHEFSYVNSSTNHNHKLMKSGILTAAAIAIHNFPEGIAAFSTASTDFSIGLPLALAIAVHNIPEGIVVAVTIFKSTGKRKTAFLWALISGLAEPVGGILGYLLLSPFMGNMTLGVILGIVAGIMVYISIDELLPLAHEYGEEHTSIFGIIIGMAVIAATLLVFA